MNVQVLRDTGIDVPEPLGFDTQGRTVTEHVPGTLIMDSPALGTEQLGTVGSMVRATAKRISCATATSPRGTWSSGSTGGESPSIWNDTVRSGETRSLLTELFASQRRGPLSGLSTTR